MSLNYYGDCFLTDIDKNIFGSITSIGISNQYVFISYNSIYVKGTFNINQYEVIISMRKRTTNSTNFNTFRLLKTDNLGLYFISSNGDFNLYNILFLKLPITNGVEITPNYTENTTMLPPISVPSGNVGQGINGINEQITLDPRQFNSSNTKTTLEVDENQFGITQNVLKFFYGVGLKGNQGKSEPLNGIFGSEYLIDFRSSPIIPLKFNQPINKISSPTNITLKVILNFDDDYYASDLSRIRPPVDLSGIGVVLLRRQKPQLNDLYGVSRYLIYDNITDAETNQVLNSQRANTFNMGGITQLYNNYAINSFPESNKRLNVDIFNRQYNILNYERYVWNHLFNQPEYENISNQMLDDPYEFSIMIDSFSNIRRRYDLDYGNVVYDVENNTPPFFNCLVSYEVSLDSF